MSLFNERSSVGKISVTLFFLVLVSIPEVAHAYIGPGAGFAFLGSAFVVVLTFVMALVTIFVGPLIWAFNKARGKGIPRKARARRIVIVGLDGLDPNLTDRFIKEGALPNLAKLAQTGSYQRLQTTLPAISPVAWATFQTGVNPGAHNIFDFLTRDKRYCLPELSSTKTVVENKKFKFGPFSWTKPRATVKLLRMSKPFWKILGDHGIFSNILRVPISYPAEKFKGNILSGMCSPDLRGTQGSFSLFSTKDFGEKATGGWFCSLKRVTSDTAEEVYEGTIQGPPDPKGGEKGTPLEIPFIIRGTKASGLKLFVQDHVIALEKDKFSSFYISK